MKRLSSKASIRLLCLLICLGCFFIPDILSAIFRYLPSKNNAHVIKEFNEVKIVHGGCIYICADYSLAITGEGIVTYEGRQFVKIKGTRSKTLTFSQRDNITNAINASHFFSLPPERETPQMDGSFVIVSVRFLQKNQELKKVIAREEQPYQDQNVAKLVKTIEQVADIAEWVGTPQDSQEMQKH